MHRCIYFCSLFHCLYKAASTESASVSFAQNHRCSGDKMFCFSQLNSTYTRTNTPLPATVCQTPAAPTQRLTAELDWITLWIFSCSWVNTLANMWFINMPGATPSSVRQRLISYSNTERRFPEFQPHSSGNQPGGKKKNQLCSKPHTYFIILRFLSQWSSPESRPRTWLFLPVFSFLSVINLLFDLVGTAVHIFWGLSHLDLHLFFAQVKISCLK